MRMCVNFFAGLCDFFSIFERRGNCGYSNKGSAMGHFLVFEKCCFGKELFPFDLPLGSL
jgi:hypothetical protein